MMFKKWRTTGLNKAKCILAALLVVFLLAGMSVFAAAEEEEYGVTFSGFDIEFDVDTDYYLAQPEDFENCKITGYTGFTSFTVTVEQYASYYPYNNTAYALGDALELGHGRAKVTLDVTMKDGEEREYLIALTDPDAADYAYARAKVNTQLNMRAEPNKNSPVLATLLRNARVYYLKTVGDWCMVEQISTGKVGYVDKQYLQWNWREAEAPAAYQAAVEELKAAHPNWTFSYMDMEITLTEALEKYGAANKKYIDPINYLAEDKIFALLNVDIYDQETWSDAGIREIWANESAITKDQAVEYFNAASDSLLMNPLYIACRAALESGYGTSRFAKGTITGYEGYYNFFGIQCYDDNPTVGAAYAKNRNWNSVFRSIVEGANWIKDQYMDQGAITPYFFRYCGFQNKVYMSDVQAPLKEASILKKAFKDPDAKAHFIVPVYRAEEPVTEITAEVESQIYTAQKESEGVLTLKLPEKTQKATLTVPESMKLYADPACTIAVTSEITLSQKITTFYGDGYVLRIESDREPVEYTDAADFDEHWVKPYIDFLSAGRYGIFNGDEAGKLNIQDNITRYEIAAIATRVLGLDISVFDQSNAALNYDDTLEEWAVPYVRAAAAVGIMNGHGDGDKIIFDGEAFATREQVTKVLVNVCVLNEGGRATYENGAMKLDAASAYYEGKKNTVDSAFKGYTFQDTAKVSDWATPYMKLAVAEFKMIGGSGENGKLYLNPQNNITRAEVAKMVAVYYEK